MILRLLKKKKKRSWNFFWLPHAKSWLIGKDPDASRTWGQEEKGTTEDEMAGWHHWLDGLESKQAPGVGDGQGGLMCCSSWGHEESDMTEWLKWTKTGTVGSSQPRDWTWVSCIVSRCFTIWATREFRTKTELAGFFKEWFNNFFF